MARLCVAHVFACRCSWQGMSDMDVDTFCSRCVDPMGEESDHVQLVALTDTLQVGPNNFFDIFFQCSMIS